MTEHRLALDRFEGDLAVVELDAAIVLDLPRWMLPDDAREGDVFRVVASGAGGERSVRIGLDQRRTAASRERVEGTLRRLARGDAGGDLEPAP